VGGTQGRLPEVRQTAVPGPWNGGTLVIGHIVRESAEPRRVECRVVFERADSYSSANRPSGDLSEHSPTAA
jgi:hypothetical protein